jgi:hypothetical protein
VTYSLVLAPFKIYVFLKILKFNNEEIPFNLNICLYCNLCIGMIMFFIRSSETNFYNIIFCFFCRKRENKENNYFVDVPLTSIISRNMNLEFMCCILYGLSDIFNKDEIRKRKKFNSYDIDECTFNITDGERTNNFSKYTKDSRIEKTPSGTRSLLTIDNYRK